MAQVSVTTTITISPALSEILQIPGSGVVGQTMTGQATASGGVAPYTYSAVNPNTGVSTLPPGLTLNPNTGAISGTLTGAGTFNLTVTATDSGS